MVLTSVFLKSIGKRAVVSWVWWYMPVIACTRRLRQEEEFKASVGQIVKLPYLGLQG